MVLNLFSLKLPTLKMLALYFHYFFFFFATEKIIEQFFSCKELRQTRTGQMVSSTMNSYFKSLLLS